MSGARQRSRKHASLIEGRCFLPSPCRNFIRETENHLEQLGSRQPRQLEFNGLQRSTTTGSVGNRHGKLVVKEELEVGP
jgi:hypothetical protein